MGCICSKPQAQELFNAPPDIRARYSIDSVRHNADLAGDASIGVHVHTRHGPRDRRNTSSSSNSSSLTRAQRKQMRALARSNNSNPQFHQLQLLPSHALNHQSQPEPTTVAAALAAGLRNQQQHHAHQHWHTQPVVHATLSTRQAFDFPQHQGLSFGTLSPSNGHHQSHSSKDKPHTHKIKECLSPEQVLALCGAVVQLEWPDAVAVGIHPLLLASVCLTESGGCPKARQFRDHLGDVALGLCQMTLSSAQWLASTKGFDRYGTSPVAADLEDPKRCLYYCAAYLLVLSRHGGCQRNESFLVKAYHAGPKGVDTGAASLYWQKYLKAKHCLREVARAMAVTVATAAAAAQLPLMLPTAHLVSNAGADHDVVAVCNSSSKGKPAEDSRSNSRCSSSTSEKDNCSGKDAASVPKDSSKIEDVMIWSAAARLISDLASSWDDPACSAGSKESQEGTDPAVSSSSNGSFIASILPSFWSSASSSRSQQQQQQQSGSGSSAAHPRSSRRRHGDNVAGALESSSCMQLVPVAKVAFSAALLRLCCIDYDNTCIALSNAFAAGAMHTIRSSMTPAEPGQPSTATLKGSGPWFYRRRNSSNNLHSSNTPAADDMSSLPLPCVMHVVGHSETLAQIASICGLAVPDILAANPDILEATAVQANDCIALPVPIIPPRLHVIQQGESLHSIAKAHKTSLGRILARNPELRDPSSVQPGWVVVLPGLKGESKSGAALQWLAEAAAAEAEPSEASTDQGPAHAAHQEPVIVNLHDEDELLISGLGTGVRSGFSIQPVRQGSQGAAPHVSLHLSSSAQDSDVGHDAGHDQRNGAQQNSATEQSRDSSIQEYQGWYDRSKDATSRNSSDPGSAAVEVTGSNKDWSRAGWEAANAAVAHQTVLNADFGLPRDVSAGGKAVLPAAAVGSGLFMFSVGQSVA